ncbi:MAG: SDR family oxidoreductase [Nocardioides sp.]
MQRNRGGTIAGKVVVITGAGSGIGRSLALDAAGRGARLALSDVNEVGLAETVRLLGELAGWSADGDHLHHRLLDVADRAAVAAYAEEVHAHFGVVHMLISNAGVSLTGDFADLSWEDIDWLVGVNFWGVLHCTKAFLPHLIDSGDGHVVTISSLFGLISLPSQSVYNATKYAVRGLSESLRQELMLARQPVGVTVVHPGGVRTNIVRGGRHARPEHQPKLVELFDKRMARTTPDEAAQIILDGALAGKARVLVGRDAHLFHQFGRIAGSHYQDLLVASRMRRRRR